LDTTTFEIRTGGTFACADLTDRIAGWLEAPPDLREDTRRRLVATARDRYSWEGVARGVIAAAQGRLDVLEVPGGPPPPGAPTGGPLG